MTRTIHNLRAYATLGCFMLLIMVGFSTGSAHATDVSGPISSDTTWTLAGSPYVVTGNTLVRVGVRLTIEPGVTVKFDKCTLAIGGTLIARGTPTQVITFTSNRPNPRECDWEEIKFRDSSADAVFDGNGNYLSGCIMEYCKVEYAGANQYAIHLDHASPFLHYVTVANNNTWSYSVTAGIFIWFSSPTIAHCTVSNSGIYGILSEDSSSSPTITHCTVSNSGHGIAPHSGSSPTITHCSIFNNRYTGIYVNRSRMPVPTIAHCIVFNNEGDGIYCHDAASPTITHCTVSDNGRHGIYAHDRASPIISACSILYNSDKGVSISSNSAPVLATCNIFGNADYDVFLKHIGSDISCTGAYWGTTDASEIDAHIHDFYDVSALGEVLYTPFATSPIGVPFEQNVVSPGKYLFGEAEMAFTSLAGAGIFRVTVFPDTYPPGFSSTGKPIKKKFVIHADPSITGFSGSLTLWYAQEEFNHSDISDENSLYCAYYDGDAWHPCPSTVDVTNNRVTCTMSAPGIWGIAGEDGTFPVRLSLFTAQAGDGEVSLHWCTESEVDNVGFDIWRALPEEGQYERITSELIPGAGNTSSLHIYSFNDRNVVNGVTYWYKVEAVDSDGTRTRHGPIAATPLAKVEVLEQGGVSARPDAYALFPCIPNPFNPTTTIRYQLSEPGEVSLTIYDVLGQKVRVLVSGRQPAGWYEVSWDGKDEAGRLVSSGVYLYRLEAGADFVQTRKALLLR